MRSTFVKESYHQIIVSVIRLNAGLEMHLVFSQSKPRLCPRVELLCQAGETNCPSCCGREEKAKQDVRMAVWMESWFFVA